MHTGFWWRTLKEGDGLDDVGIDGRVILKRILKKWGRGRGLEFVSGW